jgi:hypothetical protein
MAGRIEIPRWVRLIGLPLPFLAAREGAVRHVPRGLSVAIGCLGSAAVVALAIVALATVVVDRTHSASDWVEAHLTVEHGRTGRTGA